MQYSSVTCAQAVKMCSQSGCVRCVCSNCLLSCLLALVISCGRCHFASIFTSSCISCVGGPISHAVSAACRATHERPNSPVHVHGVGQLSCVLFAGTFCHYHGTQGLVPSNLRVCELKHPLQNCDKLRHFAKLFA